MVSEHASLREWIIENCRNDGLHQAEAGTVADFVVSHPEINSGRIESGSRLKKLIKQELEKTSLCSAPPSEKEFNSLIQQLVESDSQLLAEDQLETVEMTLVEYYNDFITGDINPDSETHPPIEVSSSKSEAVGVLPDPYAQEAVPIFGTKVEEIDWDEGHEKSKEEAQNSTNKFLTEDIDTPPTAEHDTPEGSRMLHSVMEKQQLMYLHGLLDFVADYLEEKGGISDDWLPDQYEKLNAHPTSVHKSSRKHGKAVILLASGIAGELGGAEEAETSESMTSENNELRSNDGI